MDLQGTVIYHTGGNLSERRLIGKQDIAPDHSI